jgi:hypothetical protein
VFCAFSLASSARRTCWGNGVRNIRVNLKEGLITEKYCPRCIVGVPVFALAIIFVFFH